MFQDLDRMYQIIIKLLVQFYDYWKTMCVLHRLNQVASILPTNLKHQAVRSNSRFSLLTLLKSPLVFTSVLYLHVSYILPEAKNATQCYIDSSSRNANPKGHEDIQEGLLKHIQQP